MVTLTNSLHKTERFEFNIIKILKIKIKTFQTKQHLIDYLKKTSI